LPMELPPVIVTWRRCSGVPVYARRSVASSA
jgi:hypothetical protein